MTPASVGVVAGAVLAAGAVQAWLLWRNRPLTAIGDEADYLASSVGGQGSGFFVRVPLVELIGRAIHRLTGAAELGLRVAMSLATVLALAATTLAACLLYGPLGGLLAALLLLMAPERAILGCHLWPDSLLSLWVALLCLLMVAFPAEPPIVLLGVVGAVAFLTRLEYLTMAPLTLIAVTLSTGSWRWSHLLVLLPSALAALVLSVRNLRRHGAFLPDNTIAFNLALAASEVGDADSACGIDESIARYAPIWQEMAPRQRLSEAARAAGFLVRHPRGWLRTSLRRLRVLVGPDSFVRQRLLASDGAYRSELARAWRGPLDGLLTMSVPLLSALALVAALDSKAPPLAIVPFGLLAVSSLFHARTRFRLGWLPGFSLLAAHGLLGLDLRIEPADALRLVSVAVLFLGFAWLPVRPERERFRS